MFIFRLKLNMHGDFLQNWHISYLDQDTVFAAPDDEHNHATSLSSN